MQGGGRGSGEGRTRPSTVQLVKRHESRTLMANMFHRKRVQTKLRVGPGNPSKHKTVQIKFYGAKAIPGKYYSLYGVNRQRHRDVCARGRVCMCLSVCVKVRTVQSWAPEHWAVCSSDIQISALHYAHRHKLFCFLSKKTSCI